MPDYSKGKIYTIRSRTDDGMIYVGSTIQPLCERWMSHKVSSKIESRKDRLIYRSINQDWDNWYIELHSLYPCSCRGELCRREGEIIREIGTLNHYIAGRTPKEYREEHKDKYKEWCEANKDKIKETQKEYRENNKEKIKKIQKEWRENNKEKHKEQQKEYRENNKDKIKKIQKEYCENNKEKLKRQMKQRYLRMKAANN